MFRIAWVGMNSLAAGAASIAPEWLLAPWRFLGRVFFVVWPGDAFQRSTWEELMHGFWISLALLATTLLLGEMITRRAGYPPSKRAVKWVSIAFTVTGFLAYFSFFNPSVRYIDFYHRHEFFHYYLGSKYSQELGYGRLYECAAVAEIELGRGAQLRKQELRDLHTKNLIVPMTETYVFKDPAQCTSHFEKERWEAFKKDIDWIESTARGTYWESMKKDHGYNPPPVWTMSGKLFSKLGPANDTVFKWLSSLDVILHGAVLGMLAWGFGWKVAAIGAVFWGCNGAGNFYWTGGGFLREDWMWFFIASLSLAKRRYFGLSGAAFVWAGLLRLFPLAAGFGWGVLILAYWLRHRRFHRDHKRFLAGCAVAFCVLVPVSLAVAGPASYKEFASHISLHKNTPLTNHMGFETMLVHNWDGRMRFARDDSHPDPFAGWKQGRLDRKHALRPVFIAVWLLLAGWTVWALRKSGQFWIGLPLSLPLLGTLTSITCYYFAMFIAFAPLVRLRPSLGPALLATAGGSQMILARFHWIDDRFTAMSYLLFAFSLLPLVAFSRPLNRREFGQWLESLRGQRAQLPAALPRDGPEPAPEPAPRHSERA
jgi:hypothetical protein